ncbi:MULTISPECIES: circadian clock KaiB family protein [Hymenobacter]|uniref:Circadian clock protein KaiB n=1 Tax=Hymenobacter jejuensis TaxID=2502781 RepID=A0A5B7ZUT5_9BACT|nr:MULTISPECIES: circadian clock KaiB family protein [Hymenobacter]MBC6988732.1 circadian clock protein KaiB [Hymenobacter sp. BT491]QDA58954.1 circadian clock protein KaiB [Hymenobacter jejuensis]
MAEAATPLEEDLSFVPEYDLQLYIAGSSPTSMRALDNLRAICAQYLSGRHQLAVVDLHQHPERASEDEVLGVPMLLKKRPGLVRRLVGDLSNRDRVLKALGLL